MPDLAAASEAYLSLQLSHDALTKQVERLESEGKKQASRADALQELVAIKDQALAQSSDNAEQELTRLQRQMADLSDHSAGLQKQVSELTTKLQAYEKEQCSPLVVTQWTELSDIGVVTPVVGTPTKTLPSKTPTKVEIAYVQPLDKRKALATLKSKHRSKTLQKRKAEPSDADDVQPLSLEDVIITKNSVLDTVPTSQATTDQADSDALDEHTHGKSQSCNCSLM